MTGEHGVVPIFFYLSVVLLYPSLQAKGTKATLFLTYVRNKVDLVTLANEDVLYRALQICDDKKV